MGSDAWMDKKIDPCPLQMFYEKWKDLWPQTDPGLNLCTFLHFLFYFGQVNLSSLWFFVFVFSLKNKMDMKPLWGD